MKAGAKIESSLRTEEKRSVIFGYSDGPGGATISVAGLSNLYVTPAQMSSNHCDFPPEHSDFAVLSLDLDGPVGERHLPVITE